MAAYSRSLDIKGSPNNDIRCDGQILKPSATLGLGLTKYQKSIDGIAKI